MTREQLQAIRKHFHSYAKEYMSRAGSMIHMMELKREHCAFVAKNCRQLAEAEGWSDDDINTAEALGFLHDIGRFPQLEEYGTFADAESINHGERGYQAIIESDLLHEMEEDRRGAVLNSVRYHNAQLLPKNLPKSHYPFLKMIRDADRLDIYRVFCKAIESGKIEEHPEIGLGVPVEGNPSTLIIEQIEKRKILSYADLTCVNDFILLILSWAYQMNYPSTLKVMRERKIVSKLKIFLPTDISNVSNAISSIESFIETEHAC